MVHGEPIVAEASTVGHIELVDGAVESDVLYAGIQIPPNGGTRATTGLLGLFRTDNAWAATPTWIQVPIGPHRRARIASRSAATRT